MNDVARLLIVSAVLALGACDEAQPAASAGSTPDPTPYDGYESELYATGANWLCHPLAAVDLCADDLDATVVTADGTATVETFAAADPALDCFYVYPTLSLDATPNSDLDPGEEEAFAARNQAARLGGLCRVYAPVYRQITLAALFGGGEADRELAYGDVLDAWKHFIANDSGGRPFVVLGHSQGASHLRRLVAEEIDTVDGLRDRLVSALLIGATVAVPPGADVGGSFVNVPLCRAPSDTGCVVSFASFRDTAPPPAQSRFGRAEPGLVAACNQPGALDGGRATLDPYFPRDLPPALALATGGETSPYADPARSAEVTTPFTRLPDFLEGECVERGEFSYLEVTVLADPGDPRADDIGGDLTPEWGLHLVDFNLVMGDLVSLVATQAVAWTTR